MCVVFALYLHCMCIVFALYLHCICVVLALYLHCICIVFILYFCTLYLQARVLSEALAAAATQASRPRITSQIINTKWRLRLFFGGLVCHNMWIRDVDSGCVLVPALCGFEMCVNPSTLWPGTLGAGAKTQFESSINEFKPHLSYDSVFIRPGACNHHLT